MRFFFFLLLSLAPLDSPDNQRCPPAMLSQPVDMKGIHDVTSSHVESRQVDGTTVAARMVAGTAGWVPRANEVPGERASSDSVCINKSCQELSQHLKQEQGAGRGCGFLWLLASRFHKMLRASSFQFY